MKVLKSMGLVLGVLALCAGFGLVGSFLSQPSVHAAAHHEAAAVSQQKPATDPDQQKPEEKQSLAVQTATEATDLPQ